MLIYSPDVDYHSDLLRQVLDIFHKQLPQADQLQLRLHGARVLGLHNISHGSQESSKQNSRDTYLAAGAHQRYPSAAIPGHSEQLPNVHGPGLFRHSLPISRADHEGGSLHLGPQYTKAVRRLKQRLIEYTVLQIPDPTKPYYLYTDAPAAPYERSLSKPASQLVSSAK